MCSKVMKLFARELKLKVLISFRAHQGQHCTLAHEVFVVMNKKYLGDPHILPVEHPLYNSISNKSMQNTKKHTIAYCVCRYGVEFTVRVCTLENKVLGADHEVSFLYMAVWGILACPQSNSISLMQ
jgi:hypothetical protein